MILSLLIIIGYCLCATDLPAQTIGLTSQNRALDSLRIELDRIHRQLEAQQGKERDILGEIAIREKQVSVEEELIRRQQQRGTSLRDSITDLEEDIRIREDLLSGLGVQILELEDRQKFLSTSLARTILADRRLARTGTLEFFISSHSWRELLSRRAMLIRLASTERSALNAYRTTSDTLQMTEGYVFDEAQELRSRKELLERKRAEAFTIEENLQIEAAKLILSKQALTSQLDEIRSNRKMLEARRREVESAHSAIRGMIERIARGEPLAGSPLFLSKGRLPWPASGSVVKKFGIARNEAFATETENPGIDIAISPNEPVRCVAAGKVSSVTWLRGFGNVCIIEHPGSFFTVYARLGQIEVSLNQSVASGDALGYANFDPVSEQHRVHFELWSGKEKKDPVEWLSDR
jgi:septal ring factor EnvC (AmiA/AmiB activator)